MAEYQVTYWRDLPSLVVAREGDQVRKSPLAGRFQEAIDEAAMRLGEIGSDDYLAGWARGDWTWLDGDPVEVADLVVAQLEDAWPADRVGDYLDSLGPAAEAPS
ncbi:MAG: hypothetical protein QOK15_2223 [Nocardioidaceae bacterium]|nr:hypothetical protein [Nocardioidaceae bacterium]